MRGDDMRSVACAFSAPEDRATPRNARRDENGIAERVRSRHTRNCGAIARNRDATGGAPLVRSRDASRGEYANFATGSYFDLSNRPRYTRAYQATTTPGTPTKLQRRSH